MQVQNLQYLHDCVYKIQSNLTDSRAGVASVDRSRVEVKGRGARPKEKENSMQDEKRAIGQAQDQGMAKPCVEESFLYFLRYMLLVCRNYAGRFAKEVALLLAAEKPPCRLPMSYESRKKHTNAILRARYDELKNPEKSPSTPAKDSVKAGSPQKSSGPKEFLPAYLSADRHEAAELVEYAHPRRIPHTPYPVGGRARRFAPPCACPAVSSVAAAPLRGWFTGLCFANVHSMVKSQRKGDGSFFTG
eukprot:COSAG05_NODE_882_length_6789_cov_6.646487_4_plen_246_part_00